VCCSAIDLLAVIALLSLAGILMFSIVLCLWVTISPRLRQHQHRIIQRGIEMILTMTFMSSLVQREYQNTNMTTTVECSVNSSLIIR